MGRKDALEFVKTESRYYMWIKWGHLCKPVYFMLMFGRNQNNTAKQYSIKNILKNCILAEYNMFISHVQYVHF